MQNHDCRDREAVPVISENETESIYVEGGIYGKDGWDRNSKF